MRDKASMLDTGARRFADSPRIVRQDLHSEILSILRDYINEGRFKSHERLNERILCDELGVSRTPLREAFKVLAAEGFLTLLPNRGAVVKPMNLSDFDAVVDVMAHLELLIGERVAANAGDDAIARVTNWHEEMHDCFKRHERTSYFQLNQQIHLELARQTANPVLEAMYATLNAKLKRYRYQANAFPERWQEAMKEHEIILDALVLRDGERLGATLRRHLLNKAAAVRGSL